MAKPVTKRQLLEIQIKTYEFYAGLIGRAVGGVQAGGARLPKWDDQRALEYRQLADELRAQLATLSPAELDAPAVDPGATAVIESATGGGGGGVAPE